MRRMGLALVLLVALLAVAAQRLASAPATPTTTSTSTGTPTPTAIPIPIPVPAPAAGPDTASRLVVRDVTVLDQDGRVAWRGDVDLAPELARIARGERDGHANDGATFGNREHRLPSRVRGWYREYVVRTPGLRGPGPQRLVLGKDGAAWYSSDHYRTFVQVRTTGGG